MSADRNVELIEDKQREHRRLEAPALRAMEYLKSEQYHEDMAGFFDEIKGVVGLGQMNDHEALIAIGKIHHIIETWQKPQATIRKFESVKKSLNEFLKKS